MQTKTSLMKIKTYIAHDRYEPLPSPRLLVLGAVHGNEKCGTRAIERVIQEIESNKIKIIRGQVTFIPVCNLRASNSGKNGKRYIEVDLNRRLRVVATPELYEEKIGNIIYSPLSNCDALLDIHSYHDKKGDAFVFAAPPGERPDEWAFVTKLGVTTIVTGWGEAYRKYGRKKPTIDADESAGTTDVARKHGARIAVTIECGGHEDQRSEDVAYRAIINAMRHLGIVAAKEREQPIKPRVIKMVRPYYRDFVGEKRGRLAKRWQNFQSVKAGEWIATAADGSRITAPQDAGNAVVVLPNAKALNGGEWFYLGS